MHGTMIVMKQEVMKMNENIFYNTPANSFFLRSLQNT